MSLPLSKSKTFNFITCLPGGIACTIRKYPEAATSCVPLLISLHISLGDGSGTVILKKLQNYYGGGGI
ncbi:MAG: hypothetical protein ACXWFB_03400 [Nitrososphaeraceae archaeon]